MDEYKTITLDKETSDKLNRMTKAELVQKLCIASLEKELAKKEAYLAKKDVTALQAKLDKAKICIEQCRAMINVVTYTWSDYELEEVE